MLEVKTYDAPVLLGHLVLFEISPDYCRDTLTIKAPAADMPMGTVLMANADGTLSPWAAAAEPEDDAPETADPTAAGVLLADVAKSSSNVSVPVLRRGASVSEAALKWPASLDAGKKKAALATLEALGIVAR